MQQKQTERNIQTWAGWNEIDKEVILALNRQTKKKRDKLQVVLKMEPAFISL